MTSQYTQSEILLNDLINCHGISMSAYIDLLGVHIAAEYGDNIVTNINNTVTIVTFLKVTWSLKDTGFIIRSWDTFFPFPLTVESIQFEAPLKELFLGRHSDHWHHRQTDFCCYFDCCYLKSKVKNAFIGVFYRIEKHRKIVTDAFCRQYLSPIWSHVRSVRFI